MAFGFTTNSNNIFNGGTFVAEAGTYNVKIVKAVATHANSTGNEMLQLDYEVIDGKYAGGQVRFDNQVWNEATEESYNNSVRRFNTLAWAVGVQDGLQIPNMQVFAQSLLNKTLAIEVKWSDQPNSKGYYNLQVTRHLPKLDGESQPNGVKRPDSNQGPTGSRNNQNGFGSSYTYNYPQPDNQPGNQAENDQGVGVDFNNPPF